MGGNDVAKAILRWEEKGLLPPHLGDALRAEVEAEERTESRRWSQYLLAGTGGAVLIIAAATFLSWVWPEMGVAGQSVTLAVVGALALGVGVGLSAAGRWRAVASLLQLTGPVIIVLAAGWSENAWPNGSLYAVLAGLVVLGGSAVALTAAVRKDDLLVALQAPLAFLSIFMALNRGTTLDPKAILWILDGLLVLALGVTGFRLRKPGGPGWLLGSFTAFLYTSVVFLFASGTLIWNMDRYAIIPVDVWLLVVVGISVWGLQGSLPEHLRNEGYERQLAYAILSWIFLGFYTTLEVLHLGPNSGALTVGLAGVVGVWYAIPRGRRIVLVTSCIDILAAAWYYGAVKAGALGSVLALAVAAAVLFWASSRMSDRGEATITP